MIERSRLYNGAAVGVVAGLMSGLFGVGGGILIVPALVATVAIDQRRAHGTSLAAVLPIATSSLAGYWLDDKIDWPVAGWLTVGALVGVLLGTKLLSHLPQRLLGFSFAGLLAFSAIRLLLDGSHGDGRATLDVAAALGLVAFGALTGLLSGLLGVGGGIVMVPFMVVAIGIPGALARGTSLAVVVPTSIVGTWRNRRNRNADMRLAVVVGIAGVVSAFVGSRVSVGLKDSVANRLFAGLLLAVALQLTLRLLREPSHEG